MKPSHARIAILSNLHSDQPIDAGLNVNQRLPANFGRAIDALMDHGFIDALQRITDAGRAWIAAYEPEEPEAESKPATHQSPRAAWPDPKKANFTLERRSDPFNPGERHEGLRRRSTDKE